MVARGLRFACAIVALALCGASGHAFAQVADDDADVIEELGTVDAVSPAVTPSPAITQRLLAQQGLGIGLISNVLQSQLQIYEATKAKVGQCHQIDRGGSVKLQSYSGTVKKFLAVVEIYYDARCTKVYIHAPLTWWLTSASTATIYQAKTSYRGPTGKLLGTLKITDTARKLSSKVTQISGIGNFERVDGPHVHIGLNCPYPIDLYDKAVFYCNLGIAQSVAAVNHSLASLTKMKMTVHKVSATSFNNMFTGTASLWTGALGSLNIVAPTDQTLKVSGKPKPVKYGSTTVAGVEPLTVFSPRPTNWTVTDTGHREKFSLTESSTEVIEGMIKPTTGTALAVFSMDHSGDQSGTGLITYSKGKSPIVSWTIGD